MSSDEYTELTALADVNETLNSIDSTLKSTAAELHELLTPKTRDGLLAGLFFHTYSEDRRIRYQGYILRHDAEHVVAQLLSWLDGGPTNLQVFARADVATWTLYQSAEDMDAAFKRQARAFERELRETRP